MALAVLLAAGAVLLVRKAISPWWALPYAGAFAGIYWCSLQPWSSPYWALGIAIAIWGIGRLFPLSTPVERGPGGEVGDSPSPRRCLCFEGRGLGGGVSLPIVLFGLLVAYFSGGQGSAEPMSHFLSGFAWLSPEVVEGIVIGVRKAIHLFFYAGLAVCGVSAACRSGGRLAIGAGLLWALAHAVFDETRQMGVPGRTGSWWDVLLDTVGMAVGLAWLWWRSRQISKGPPPPACNSGSEARR